MNLDRGRGLPQVLNGAARAWYLALLERGGRIPVADVQGADEDVLQRLLSLGLVVRQVDGTAYAAVSPRAIGARLSADLRATGTRLLAQADELPPVLAELTQAYDAAPPLADERTVVQHLDDSKQIRYRIAQLEAACRHELLAAQPGGARPTFILGRALALAEDFRQRSVSLRTIYQPGARTDAPTAYYAAGVTKLGGRIRVLDEPFQRMLIFDRTTAVIEAGPDGMAAAFVEDTTVIGSLVDLFERDWQRAERVQWDEPAPAPARGAGRLLAQGLTQRAIASRLGLSERTVAAQIARLREEYDAETLFQLGWQMRGSGGPGDR